MPSGEETVKAEEATPVPLLAGLEWAQQKFGPLLSPVPATTDAWTQYTLSRTDTVQAYGNRESLHTKPEQDQHGGASRPREYSEDEASEMFQRKVSTRLEALEREMDFTPGTFSKCVSVLYSWVNLEDASDDTLPRDGDIVARIYSPSTPACIDVNFTYHFRARFTMNSEWRYNLAYKIHRWPGQQAPDPATVAERFKNNRGWRTPSGWKQIGEAFFDDRGVERGNFRLDYKDTLDIYDALLGPVDKPDKDAPEETKVAFRRRLAWSIRLLLASVGIGYNVACAESERDIGVSRDMQWKITIGETGGSWFARGVRKACGFELSRDTA